jgi:hypothetical protein
MSDTFNDLLTSDAAAFKFETIGDTCKGRVVRAERKQQTDPGTGELKFFKKSNDPMMQLVITIDQDNGDGETAIYCKGGKYEIAEGKGQAMLPALQAAVGAQEFRAGGQLAVQYSGNGKKTEAAFTAPKLYTVQYREPAITISDDEDLI